MYVYVCVLLRWFIQAQASSHVPAQLLQLELLGVYVFVCMCTTCTMVYTSTSFTTRVGPAAAAGATGGRRHAEPVGHGGSARRAGPVRHTARSGQRPAGPAGELSFYYYLLLFYMSSRVRGVESLLPLPRG